MANLPACGCFGLCSRHEFIALVFDPFNHGMLGWLLLDDMPTNGCISNLQANLGESERSSPDDLLIVNLGSVGIVVIQAPQDAQLRSRIFRGCVWMGGSHVVVLLRDAALVRQVQRHVTLNFVRSNGTGCTLVTSGILSRTRLRGPRVDDDLWAGMLLLL
ncbi:hypothetical protein BC834DRAFT_847774 [Gloeopeniophorella convolvens]|nr:hypothetical protein BC834DRAFT_847774 [Gloeopeniophorella convolvens]